MGRHETCSNGLRGGHPVSRTVSTSGHTQLTAAQIDEITGVGRLSRIDNLQTQGLTKGLQEREQAKLGQIAEAFKRIEAGTFGQCVDFGRPIAFERLLIFPEAPNCAGCVGR